MPLSITTKVSPDVTFKSTGQSEGTFEFIHRMYVFRVTCVCVCVCVRTSYVCAYRNFLPINRGLYIVHIVVCTSLCVLKSVYLSVVEYIPVCCRMYTCLDVV